MGCAPRARNAKAKGGEQQRQQCVFPLRSGWVKFIAQNRMWLHQPPLREPQAHWAQEAAEGVTSNDEAGQLVMGQSPWTDAPFEASPDHSPRCCLHWLLPLLSPRAWLPPLSTAGPKGSQGYSAHLGVTLVAAPPQVPCGDQAQGGKGSLQSWL